MQPAVIRGPVLSSSLGKQEKCFKTSSKKLDHAPTSKTEPSSPVLTKRHSRCEMLSIQELTNEPNGLCRRRLSSSPPPMIPFASWSRTRSTLMHSTSDDESSPPPTTATFKLPPILHRSRSLNALPMAGQFRRHSLHRSSLQSSQPLAKPSSLTTQPTSPTSSPSSTSSSPPPPSTSPQPQATEQPPYFRTTYYSSNALPDDPFPREGSPQATSPAPSEMLLSAAAAAQQQMAVPPPSAIGYHHPLYQAYPALPSGYLSQDDDDLDDWEIDPPTRKKKKLNLVTDTSTNMVTTITTTATKTTTITLDDEMRSRPYPCPKCPRRFNRRYNLNAHIRIHDPNRKKLFDCHICTQSFDRKHDRDRHVDAIHYQNKRRVHCELCEASFTRRDALTRHMHKIHNTRLAST
ncbi:hypothetical protein DM01DRAFT_1331244 [Hesseltinella vesiculosa]|uniref:C2H2-type domain-containing protein n=1 Tax=Hesseltinella vesiculosa TaxID=101127 RepID=A0A1X2GYJ8_9FUNG|nr:hypothetical protein DM01DRAFT_1331244 [Hesseltinella vesiculosa]